MCSLMVAAAMATDYYAVRMLPLSEIAPISVQDYDAFVARDERFYVYGQAG